MYGINRGLIPVLALAMSAAAPAAALTFTHTVGAPDPGPASGETLITDFSGPNPFLSGDYGFATGTGPGAAAPAGDVTQYLYTSSAIGTGIATLSTLDLSTISFYWGSIDGYNSVDVLGAGGVTLRTISGSDFTTADGNQTTPQTNQRVYFTAEGGEVITGLRFHATGVAFEVDTVDGTLIGGGSGSTVPEPASWGLMISGFAMVGLGARRRRNTARRVTA